MEKFGGSFFEDYLMKTLKLILFGSFDEAFDDAIGIPFYSYDSMSIVAY